MFDKQKYMTKGIQQEIGLDIQVILWSMIDNLKQKDDFKIDYLQVFDLEIEDIGGLKFQKITHKQEVEPYSITNTYMVRKPVSSKIFVIDSDDYCTMMLSNEY